MVKINKEKCVGCGLCTSICEEVFKMGKDGKAEVKSEKELPCVKEAISSCPASAITK
jgi:ferredoxin